MDIDEFYPFVDGQVVTADEWNELFSAIQTGDFFLDEGVTGVSTLADRVSLLEEEVDMLQESGLSLAYREQFLLSAEQASLSLNHAPILYTDYVYINGILMVPQIEGSDVTGDYVLSGSTITFSAARKLLIEENDVCEVLYKKYSD